MKKIIYLTIFLSTIQCGIKENNNNNDEIKNENIVIEKGKKGKFIHNNPDYQVFNINSKKRQIIKGKEGTILEIPKNSFFGQNDSVKIVLIECYSILSIIENNIVTITSKNELLETDGMIYLNALSKSGDTLSMLKPVKITIPTKIRKKGIKIFKGLEENNISWQLSNVKLIKNEIIPIKKQDSLVLVINKSNDSNIINTGKSYAETPKNLKSRDIPEYVFRIANLGWINCDRYIKGRTNNLIVKVNDVDASFYLVLNDYNSVIQPIKLDNEKIEFSNLPSNSNFTIVAIGSKNNKLYFNMIDYLEGKTEINYPFLKPISRQQLTDTLINKFGKDIWNRPAV